MSFTKIFTAVILAAFAAASPLADVSARAHVAQVTMYTSGSCTGDSWQYNVGDGPLSCKDVTDPASGISTTGSISVVENDCKTYVWSGAQCQGDRTHISGDKCHPVMYASVSVQC